MDKMSRTGRRQFTRNGVGNTGLLVLCAALAGPAAAADDTDSASFELGELIVTAQRPRVVKSVSTVSEITLDDIVRSGARTLDEALVQLPGLYLRDGADGIPRVDVRGLRTRNILLLVDGVPVNSTFDGQFDPSAIPVENIARIDFTRGGSSVLYGPGGNAGVINIITLDAAEQPSGYLLAEQTFEDAFNARGRFAVRGDKLSWFVSGSVRDQDHWELSDDFEATSLQPAGERIASDREDQAASSSLSYEFSDATSVGLGVGYSAGEYGKPPITVDRNDSPFANRVRYERTEYDGYTSQLAARHAFGDTVSIRPAVFFNERDELTDGYDDDTYVTQDAAGAFSEDATTTIKGGGLQLAFDTPGMGLLTLSGSGRNERWQATGFTIENSGGGGSGGGGSGGGGGGGGGTAVVEAPIDEDQDVSLYSLAGEWEKAFSNGLSTVAGASWNQQTRDDASDADEWAYLVGARYAFSDSTRIRGSYARQIRFPTLRDLYEADRGNPDLDPEKTDNIELALQHDLLDGRSTVEFVLYQVDAEDFIERGLSGLAENFEETRFRGVELNGRYAAGEHLQLRLGYTYLDAENRSADAEKTELQNRPEHKLSLRMDYDLATGTRFHGSYMYVAGAVALSRNTPVTTTEVGDYNVFDLGVSQPLWNDRVRLVGRVENLFDEDYQESFGFPQPGRRFYIGAEFRL